MRAEVQALLLAGVAALTFDAGMLLLNAPGDRLPAPGLPPGPAALRAFRAGLALVGGFDASGTRGGASAPACDYPPYRPRRGT